MFKQVLVKLTKTSRQNGFKNREVVYLDFALAEFASAIEMLQAAKLVDQKMLAKGFLRHALDEYEHTEFFKQLLKDDPTNHIKFDPRLAEKLGFLRTDLFLFERKSLQNFSAFIAVNEANALKVFLNIRPFITKTNIEKIPRLDQIIFDEIEHLTNNQNQNEVQQIFSSLLKDEARHARLSNDYLKKVVSPWTFRYLKSKYWLGNKARHFWASHKKVHSVIDGIVTKTVIFLLIKFRWALNFSSNSRNNEFNKSRARLML